VLTLRDPARRSRYALSTSPTSGRVGHGPQRLHRLLEALARKGDETRRDQHGVLDGRGRVLLEIEPQPSRRRARMPTRVLARDEEGQLAEAEPRKLSGPRATAAITFLRLITFWKIPYETAL
jgi:hypothetical protein